MCQLRDLTEKMHVLSVLCSHDKIAGKEPDSPCFVVTATQTSLETGSVSCLQQELCSKSPHFRISSPV